MPNSSHSSTTIEQCLTTSEKSSNTHTKKRLKKLQAEVCPNLRCSVCPDKRFQTLSEYDRHFTSKRHLRRKVNYSVGTSKPTQTSDPMLEHRTWRCSTCKREFEYYHDWVKHLTSPTHFRTLEEAAKSLPQSKRPAYTLTEVRKVEWLVKEMDLETEEES
ncbi:hypothetical protein K7432_004927 [Basidiobolus ranarum]|uniref:C2H2-type domain-containing protein n=1 Tax=Basidiobolus ranarum TaxID=34480 RepID=A0ABR2W3W0_9FUNG